MRYTWDGERRTAGQPTHWSNQGLKRDEGPSGEERSRGKGLYINPVFVRPWLSASWLDFFIFLLRIFLAHFLLQLTSRFPVMPVISPSMIGDELSESVAESGPVPALSMLAMGLVGRGEKVPWLQTPS
jgi:hypothetical protein